MSNERNRLRWDCSLSGCFNIKLRPKLEVFADCFPGFISFGDVDGIVEINSHVLLLEWKSSPGDLPTGQHIMYERMSRSPQFTAICVAGSAETMTVTHTTRYWHENDCKKRPEWVVADLDDIRKTVERWVTWAQKDRL